MKTDNSCVNGKTVFLAGATGSVGSALLRHLTDKYPSVRMRASYRNTEPFIRHERIEYVKGDLRSQDDCRRMVRGCDCAIMAASHSGGAKAVVSRPWDFLNNNIAMNSQMLEAFYAEKVKRVIYIGTATVYQEFEGYIKEDELDLNKDPHASYFGFAWTGRFIEKLCRFWHEKTGMEVIIVRASNIFGPYSNFDPETSYFIPAIIRKAADKMDPFDVWGSPEVTRDVLYCADLARAVTALLDDERIKFDTFNIGSGMKTTVGEVVGWALKHAGHRPSNVNYDLSKPTTIKFRALEVSKIQRVTGWRPETTIEDGIRKTVEWWTANRGNYK